MQTAFKRRSILDSQLSLSSFTGCEQRSLGNGDFPNDANIPTINKSPSLPSRLIGILTEAENMSDDGAKCLARFKSSAPHEKSFSKDQQVDCSSQSENLISSSTMTERIENMCSTSEEKLLAKKHHPTDWSLKSKMRVVVETKEESFKRVPGIDAKNVFNFVHHTLENGSDWKELDIFQKLRRCCLHYSYPQYPWLRKFPRMSGDFRSRSMSFLSNNDEVLKDIQSDWSSVFTSLYQQLRGGICPYFYVCTHQFTVLFRCQRFSPKEASLSALLSPSTRGFRELLSKEDIAFRLPNIDMHKVSTEDDKPKEDNESPSCVQARSQSTENNQNDITDKTVPIDEDCSEDEEDDINDHHGASKWLEGMGLNKKDFPSLEPLKVKLQRDGYREIDNRPQSMVYVEGGDVHAFFNFLLNYPSCIASSGPQHGLPPTLLSPVPFVGGSLVQNAVKHSQLRDVPVKVTGSKHLSYSHVFEISGPIIPHHTLNIAAVLQDYHSLQQGSSVVTYNTHLPSAALNTQAVNQPEKDLLAMNVHKLFVDFELANPGLLSSLKKSMGSRPLLASGAFLKELKISQQGYLWS
ncbi:hypothetical protein RRG08_065967 [Elysia crispata]|uniref:Uncharacterized protein n=1 Tax=Elysia crispata TaxID=231223 RepID=A0AAE1DGJ0_9GAST|nr:hypothetical protein RRG08_065967 [Elysia crispata]